MGIKSRNTTTLSGTFYLDIDVPNSNGNFDILDFGQIKYEFDIIPSDKAKPYIGGMPGAMTVKTHDQLDTGESMFDVIENAIGTYSLQTFVTTPTAAVNVVLFDQGDDNIDNAYRFPFSLSFQDLTLNEKASHLTMRLSPRRTNLTPQEWESSFITRNSEANAVRFGYKYPTNALVGDDYINVTTFNAYPVGDVIHDVVSQLDTGIGNTTIFDVTFLSSGYGDVFGGISPNLINSFATKFVPGNVYTWPTKSLLQTQQATWNIAFGSYTIAPMFITKISNDPLDSDMVEKLGNGNTIYDKMSTFAGLDGAIFGSAFGINFYINRRSNVHNVELSNNDIEELSFQSTPRDIDTVQIGTTAINSAQVYEKLFESNSQDDALAYFPVTPNQAIAYEAWKGSPDTVALDFKSFFPNLGVGVLQQDENAQLISNGTAYYFDISNTGTTPIARNFARDQIWADQVFNSAFVSYAAALGISLTNTAKYRVSTTIYGIDKVKPHEMIAFDSTTPQRYQGKFFRPSSIEYDLRACKTKITAYQVGEYTPILPNIPEEDPLADFCFGSENVYTFYEESSRLAIAVSNTSDLFAYGENSNYVTQYDLSTNTVVQNIELPSTFYGTYLFFDDVDRYLYVMSDPEKHVRIINVANTAEQTIINTFNDNSDLFAAFVEDKTRRKLYVGLDTVAANPPIMTIDLATRTRGTNVDYRTNTALAGEPQGLAIDVTRNIIVAADQGSVTGRGVYMMNLEDNSKQKLNVPSVSQNRFVHAAYAANSSSFYVFGDGADTNVHSITSPSANIALVGSVPVYDLPMTILTNPVDGQIYFVTYPSDGFYPPDTINVPLSDTYNVAVLNPLTNTFSLYTSLGADGEGKQMVVDPTTAKMYYGSALTVPTTIFEFCMQPEE